MWLRELLSEQSMVEPGQAVGTHSAKATTLSWMCKAHAPGDLQRLAGYHVDPNSRSALEYSRDAQAPVVHFIEGMLLVIFSGMFMPDQTRAGRWDGCRSLEQALDILAKTAPEDSGAPGWHDVGQAEVEKDACFSDPYGIGRLQREEKALEGVDLMESDASDEDAEAFHVPSSESEGRSEEDHEDDEHQMEVTGKAVAGLLGGAGTIDARVFKHRVSGIFHIMSQASETPDEDGEMSSTKCGKLISHNFVEVDQFESFLPTKCKRCFAQ